MLNLRGCNRSITGVRGYEDRKTGNEMREAYMCDRGFGEASVSKSEGYGGYGDRECRDMAKILPLGMMQYSIDEYNEGFCDSLRNFQTVPVPPFWT